MTSDPFDEKLAQWQAWCEAPWGRLRFAVVRETLRRQVEALGGSSGGLRVLDVGGGDGRDAVPLALDGHHVTVLDSAPSWLAEADRLAELAGVADRVQTLEGSIEDLSPAGHGYDLVLCHFVLHYRASDAGDLARLAGAVRPGGRLSVMAPNPHARVIMRLTREGPAAALAELATDDYHSATFTTAGRKVTADEVAVELRRCGLEVVGRYAARVANDYLIDDSRKEEPEYYASLERLELALCDREPFVRLGGLWQLVAARPDSPAAITTHSPDASP